MGLEPRSFRFQGLSSTTELRRIHIHRCLNIKTGCITQCLKGISLSICIYIGNVYINMCSFFPALTICMSPLVRLFKVSLRKETLIKINFHTENKPFIFFSVLLIIKCVHLPCIVMGDILASCDLNKGHSDLNPCMLVDPREAKKSTAETL